MAKDDTQPAVEGFPLPRWLIRIANPLARRLIDQGRAPAELAVLRFRGRKSGRAFKIPVGVVQLDEGAAALTDADWRYNFHGGHPVEVSAGGKRQRCIATLVDDPDEVAAELHRAIRRYGYKRAGRRLGIRINLGREPTLDEIADAARRTGLSIVYLGGGAPPRR